MSRLPPHGCDGIGGAPERAELLALVAEAWSLHPSLTLGEVIWVASHLSGADNPWDCGALGPGLRALCALPEDTDFTATCFGGSL